MRGQTRKLRDTTTPFLLCPSIPGALRKEDSLADVPNGRFFRMLLKCSLFCYFNNFLRIGYKCGLSVAWFERKCFVLVRTRDQARKLPSVSGVSKSL